MNGDSEVVISGTAGRYPGIGNTEDLWKSLLKGQNLITFADNLSSLELPKYKGGSEESRFDNTFFGIHTRLAEKMDVNTCLVMEMAFAAICDAGINPQELSGKQVPVIMASGPSKYDFVCLEKGNNGYSILGVSQCMMANRISHILNLKGPSFNIDGSWSSMLVGLRYAKSLISSGMADAAIVGCGNIGKLDECAFHFKQMGRLNEDGKTKCFSDDADGYARSEACMVFFLQKKEVANRIYGTLIKTTTGNNYNKDLPLGDVLDRNAVGVLRKSYEKHADIIKDLSYIECSGEAMKYWDKIELNSVSEVMLQGRTNPLLIGSVKSIVGHSEDSAAGLALVKTLCCLDTGIIPPNLHYSTPNKDVPALVCGKIKVVTEPTKLEGGLVGINNYSVDGSLSHVIIKRNPKEKKREPKVGVLPDGIPRLFVASARNEKGIKQILKKVEEMPIDEEFIALGQKLFKNAIKHYSFRGYTILNENSQVINEIKDVNVNYKKSVWFVFSGMGSQWAGMGVKLMKIPLFANAIYKCHNVLKPKGIDLIDVITTTDDSVFENILNSFVGIAAIQIGLVDILNAIGLVPDGILGHSVGELGCAYADGCFTAEQMILAAYARGKASIDAELIPGMMAAVGMSYNDIKDKIPEGIDVACHNSSTNCTLSGPTKLMEEYINSIKAKGVFAKLVNASNIAYHSRYIQPAAPALLESLKKVIPSPKKRSQKWISSSVPAEDWNTEMAMYSSAEYHTNNLLKSVLFEEASQSVPKDAIVVEIAPHGLLQAILKKSLPNATHISLTHRAQPDSVIYLLTALGKLYLEGIALDLNKLYPPVEFPVSRGTPSYEPFVTWNHDLEIRNSVTPTKHYSKHITIEFNNEKYLHLKEFSIYGQPFIPPAVYLDLIIEHFQSLNQRNELLVIEEFKVKYNPKIIRDQCQLYICLQNGTGEWELSQEDSTVSNGHITHSVHKIALKEHYQLGGTKLFKDEIYNYLSIKGIDIGECWRLIHSFTFSEEGGLAEILWNGNWSGFMDSILLLTAFFGTDFRPKLKLLSSIQRLIIDINFFSNQPQKVFKVSFDKKSGLIWCEGLDILYPQLRSLNVPKRSSKKLAYQTLQFVPYAPSNMMGHEELLEYWLQILVQNIIKATSYLRINIIEVTEGMKLHNDIVHAIKKTDGIKVDIMKMTSAENVTEYATADDYDCTIIVCGPEDLNSSFKFLKLIKQGYLLLFNQKAPSSFVTVLESNSFVLCKVISDLAETPDFVMLSDPCWKTNLKRKISFNIDHPVYVVGCSTSLPCISRIVEECEELPNSAVLRYIFFDENPVKFNLSQYKTQLVKDLKINIHHNGEWGTYRLIPSIVNKPCHAGDKSIFTLSNLRCPGLKLNVNGINLADVSGSHRKIGIIEYVGEKDGEEVCGLATFSDDSQTLQPDKQLLWKKPTNWKDDEIASVLLAYSMAYYILKVDNHLLKGEKIYVSQGIHPLSQAFITIALKNGLEVFTSYRELKQKNWIRELFPEIPENNLIDLKHKQLDAVISLKTHGENMKIVINTLPESHMVEKSFGAVGIIGKFYQISLSPMKSDESIGMYIFLKQTTMIGFSPESLMLLPDIQKKELRELVEVGLKSGDIKPLPVEKFTSADLNVEAVSILTNEVSMHKKVIVNMEDRPGNKKVSPFYTASPDKSYLIIGDKKNFWIHICQWLVKRGAKNIYLVLRKNSLTTSSILQFNSLLNMNPLLNLNLLSLPRIKDKLSVSSTLKEISTFCPLSAVFVIGKENENTVKNICEIKENVLLVSLCAGGETECEARTKFGINSLAIRASDDLLKSHIILPLLDLLLCQKKSVVYVSELKGTEIRVHDLTTVQYFQSLPNTSSDILQLINSAKKAGWREVRTNGFKVTNSRELNPVFIFPTLKKSHIEYLMRSLISPAYEAIIPPDVNQITDLAKQLSQEISKFKINEITLICSDWSWSLGLEIARFLEEDDKTVSIIALDSSAKRNSKSHIQDYVSEIKLKSSSNQTEILKGLKILENRLDYMHAYDLCNRNKNKGFLHILKPEALENNYIDELQQYFERQILIHSIPGTDFSSMLNERSTADLVNSLVLFEHKTGGRKVYKQYIERSVIEHRESILRSQ